MANSRPRHGSTCSIVAGFEAHKADLPIDIIVIGAGIAGLACAYSLRQAGHNVLVLESENGLGTSPSGIRVPPNMSRILFRWGLGPAIVGQTSGRCPKILFHSAYTGEVMGELLYHEKVMEELEGEVYLLHHSDLLRMLYDLATGVGVNFKFGSRVVEVDSETPTVKLASGKRVQADLIVGADGHQSIIRSALGPIPRERDEANYTTYQFTVPVSRLSDDEDFRQVVKEPIWNLWMGSGWAVLGFAVRNNTEFTVSILKDESDADLEYDWKRRKSIHDFDIVKDDWAPTLKRIAEHANDVVRVKGDRSTMLDSWYDSKRSVVAVGEAAHGWNPGSSHTAALAIEDAVVLGRLLSKLRHKGDISRFLSAFQEIRQPRSERVCITEHKKVDFVAIPSGPQQEERDQSMRLQMEEGQVDWTDAEDSFLRRAWEEFRDAFGYDAFDDADTWWVEWGVLSERVNGTKETTHTSTSIFDGQITIEEARHVI